MEATKTGKVQTCHPTYWHPNKEMYVNLISQYSCASLSSSVTRGQQRYRLLRVMHIEHSEQCWHLDYTKRSFVMMVERALTFWGERDYFTGKGTVRWDWRRSLALTGHSGWKEWLRTKVQRWEGWGGLGGEPVTPLCLQHTPRTAVAVQEGFLRILKHITSLCRQCGVQSWGKADGQRYTLGKLVWPRSKENQNSHQWWEAGGT